MRRAATYWICSFRVVAEYGVVMRRFGLLAVGFKGFLVLEALAARSLKPDFVVTYPQAGDRSRAHERIGEISRAHHISLFQRSSPNLRDLAEGVDITFAVGWQYLVGELTRLIVLHDSILPRYRGFAPVVTSLINGESRIGVTAMSPVDAIDAGPICASHAVDIDYPITIESAFRKILASYLACISEMLSYNRYEEIPFRAQDDDRATYSIWLSPDDQYIDWRMQTDVIARQINAMGFPYGGAKTRWGNSDLIVQDPIPAPPPHFERRQPGKIWQLADGDPIVVTGDGLLRVRLTDENGNRPQIPIRTWFR